jgi:hypothetical protein
MRTHKANLNFYLYTGMNETAADSVQAITHLNESGIQYTHLHYFHNSQMTEVLTWAENSFANTEYAVASPQFPFVVYEKAYDIRDNPPRDRVLVHGIDNILSTLWATLESFEG